MKKLLLLSLVLLATHSGAQMLNGIAMVVEGEPVTVAEIQAVQKQMRVSKEEAKELLIENRLQRVAMKNIAISEDEIDKQIAFIAKQNNLTIPKLQSAIKQQGLTWNKFREQMRTNLKKQTFFRSTIVQTMPEPSGVELKRHYEKNIALFKMPSSINVTEYSATSAKLLEDYAKNSSHAIGVHSRNITLRSAEITPQLLTMLSGTPSGKLTAPISNGNGYISYRVKGIGASTIRPFSEARDAVARHWKLEQQGVAIDAYFKKMKSSAHVKIIRP